MEGQHEDNPTTAENSESSSDVDAVDPRLESMPFIEAFGHRYHASGKIYLPFDQHERERLEILHKVFRHCLDGALTHTRLPLDTAQILDLGTGTGVWPVEMAVRYPQAQITGIDVYPIQRRNGVPPNVKFEIGNVEEPLDCPDNSLDFVHARGIAGGIHDWPALLQQVYNKLKPGGLFEMTEVSLNVLDFDGKFAEADLCPEFLRIFRELSTEVGVDFDPSRRVTDWLLDAEFEKIVQRSEILPMGNWAQDEKLKTRQNLINQMTNERLESSFMDNHCGLLFQSCGWTKEKYDEIVPSFWQEIRAATGRPYITA
ncbi:S-adenosyl-L-methionine-dependent methyltransferase [Hypoxylon trugodes]|uniref:S-adenosyl-L-methionine-dependent methyltransferase n=1 Tax=Hypoxylon trugodes TaxID=326681 RepID=UPI0021982644|nr:S-adenosyl-L-methionine-dependent methyltransferase [Hypoxylon trugodes]KAI1392603.1 S-adenosyl-L-methionine-dependent methyltransferase [Hypoxylon trugodes]